MKLQSLLTFIAACLIAITVTEADDEFTLNHGHFTKHLYTTLASQNAGKSLAVSPLSLQTCFSMLYMGTKGPAANELERGFHLGSSDRKVISENFKNILQKYKDSSLVQVANKIYVDQHAELLPEFKKIVTENFYSDIGETDLTKGEETATTINNWVKEKTNGKIEKLINSGDCNSDTRLILLNAVYFKGNWKYPFNKEKTEKKPFHVSASETVDVDMMNVVNKFRFKKLSGAKLTAIELPYADSDLSMLVLVPGRYSDLAALETDLQEINFQEIQDQMTEREISLSMPKFKVETEVDLKEFLPLMGVEKIFKDGDFDDLAKSDSKFNLVKAVHKAVVEVNEEGTEAGASTGVTMTTRSGPLPIRVDKPFMFVIRDSTGNNLFIGRVLGK